MLGWWEYSCISWIFRTEDGKLQCIGQCIGWFTIFYFHKLNLIAAQLLPLIYVFSMVAFRLQRQNKAEPVKTENLWPASPKIFTLWLLQIKLAESWFRRTRMKTSCDFPGVPVVKNLPCNAGDVSSTPGQGTKVPHTWNNWACEPQLENQCAAIIPHNAIIPSAATKAWCNQIQK